MIVKSPKNLIDWKKQKVIIFQSDDWGCCGWTPNNTVYEKLKNNFASFFGNKGVDWSKSTLERIENLENLFSILEKYTDKNGKHPCFQAAYVVSNPDFEKIEAHNFKEYFDLVLPEVPSLWQRGDIVKKAKEGIKRGVWYPTYHGRSHFDYYGWLKQLQQNNPITMQAFRGQVIITDSYEYNEDIPYGEQEKNLKIGIGRFKRIFGFSPKSTIAPSYKWQEETEKLFSKYGLQIIQGKNYQENQRTIIDKLKGKIINILGYKSSNKTWQIQSGDYNSRLDITYLKRNVYFEPEGKEDNATHHGATGAYNQILKVWENNEPAIVISHRVNYTNHNNAYVDINLKQLDKLLNLIHSNHHDINYFYDEELVGIYKTGRLKKER